MQLTSHNLMIEIQKLIFINNTISISNAANVISAIHISNKRYQKKRLWSSLKVQELTQKNDFWSIEDDWNKL